MTNNRAPKADIPFGELISDQDDHPAKKPLTLGDLVVSAYRGRGKYKAIGIIRLAIAARLIKFSGRSVSSPLGVFNR